MHDIVSGGEVLDIFDGMGRRVFLFWQGGGGCTQDLEKFLDKNMFTITDYACLGVFKAHMEVKGKDMEADIGIILLEGME